MAPVGQVFVPQFPDAQLTSHEHDDEHSIDPHDIAAMQPTVHFSSLHITVPHAFATGQVTLHLKPLGHVIVPLPVPVMLHVCVPVPEHEVHCMGHAAPLPTQ